jgi:hypothetical protein
LKKLSTIIQLVILAAIIIYGTICLYMGYFEGAYATLPFLFFYYVYSVAIKNRRNRKEINENKEDQP